MSEVPLKDLWIWRSGGSGNLRIWRSGHSRVLLMEARGPYGNGLRLTLSHQPSRLNQIDQSQISDLP